MKILSFIPYVIFGLLLTVTAGLSSESIIKSVPIPGPSYRAAKFTNSCSNSTIYLTIRYQDKNKNWITRGWWSIPYQKTVTVSNRVAKDFVYYYARNSQNVIWEGEYKYKVHKKKFIFNSVNGDGKKGERYEKFRKGYIRKVINLTCK